MRIVSCVALCACVVFSGCAIQRVAFDNNTTYEDKANHIRMSERNVAVAATFTTSDVLSSQVQERFHLDQDGAASAIKSAEKMNELELEHKRAEDEIAAVQKDREELTSIETAILDYQSDLVSIPKAPPAGVVPAGSLESVNLDENLQKRFEDTPQLKPVLDQIVELPAWKALKEMTEASDEDRENLRSAIANLLSSESFSQITSRNRQRIAELQSRLKTKEKEITYLSKALDEIGVAGEDNQLDLKQLVKLAAKLKTAGTGVAAAADPAQALAIDAIRERMEDKKKDLVEAKDQLKQIQQLSMPSITRLAAESSQKKYIQDLQGQYDEAYQEYVGTVSQVSAMTNYDGPGERSHYWSINFLGEKDAIQRYPNGLVKSIGTPPNKKGLGDTFTKELFRSVRVLALPAAWVFGLHELNRD